MGTLEGEMFFPNYYESLFNMFVLLTTSNFPDIMLPAYELHPSYGLFFIIFLIIGLFFIMNLLLAIAYSNYKVQFTHNIEKNQEKRSEYLLDLF